MKILKGFISKISYMFTMLSLFLVLSSNNANAAEYTVVIKNLSSDGQYGSLADLARYLGEIKYLNPNDDTEIDENCIEENAEGTYTYTITSDLDNLKLKCSFSGRNDFKTVEINGILFFGDENTDIFKNIYAGSTTYIEYLETNVDCKEYTVTLPNLSNNNTDTIESSSEILYTIDNGTTWFDINNSSSTINEDNVSYLLSVDSQKDVKLKCKPAENMPLYIDGKFISLSSESNYIFSLNKDVNIEFKAPINETAKDDNKNIEISQKDKDKNINSSKNNNSNKDNELIKTDKNIEINNENTVYLSENNIEINKDDNTSINSLTTGDDYYLGTSACFSIFVFSLFSFIKLMYKPRNL